MPAFERAGPRRQIAGPEAIGRALDEEAPLRVVLVREGLADAGGLALLERARRAGVKVRRVSGRVVRRLSHERPPAEMLGLVGAEPGGGLDDVLSGGGAVWLLAGVRYPGNAGFAIRTAEVSGADGIVVDAGFDRTARRDALRLSMRADWFMPVLWEPADRLLDRAAQTGHRVIGIEDVGTAAPWQLDLTGPLVLAIGGEEPGLPEALLRRCDSVARIPMGGFIRSYNLQAALAAVAAERLRQMRFA